MFKCTGLNILISLVSLYFFQCGFQKILNFIHSLHFGCFFLFVCYSAVPWGLRDLRSWPGIEPGPSAVKAQSPNHWTAREFLALCFCWTCTALECCWLSDLVSFWIEPQRGEDHQLLQALGGGGGSFLGGWWGQGKSFWLPICVEALFSRPQGWHYFYLAKLL